MKITWGILIVVAVAAAAVWWACSDNNGGSPSAPGDDSVLAPLPPSETGGSSVTTQPLGPAVPLPEPGQDYHGLSWQIHHTYQCVQTAQTVFAEIAELGADTVLISNAAVQEHAASESFRLDPERTPSGEQWQQILDLAHHHGLRVILMPLILLTDPRGTEWRGEISPPNWDDWFDQYTRFILHFARIAREGRVEVLMVGSELISTETFTDRWREVIRAVRREYPGKLTYSANWDHYKVIEFWDDLDLVGMTSYYKLSSEPVPELQELIDAWKPIKRGILRWQERIDRPLLFTEVGWCSQEGASIEPWNYYHDPKATPGGLEEQLRCYRAFMRTWDDTPEVGGVIWWEWTTDPGGPQDFNYTPRGKPAEVALREWFEANRVERMPSSTTRPAEPTPARTGG
jgi:hypothetical protein